MSARDSRKLISSTAYVDGPSLFGSQDGQPPEVSGPAPAPASPIRRRAKGKVTPTRVISGQHSSGSSASVALSALLVSKLRPRLDTVGSMEFVQTWKERATPSGRLYSEHTARQRRISDSDCFGWPSPQKHDAQGAKTLELALLTSWPTPNVPTRGPESRASKDGRGSGGIDLQTTAQLCGSPSRGQRSDGGAPGNSGHAPQSNAIGWMGHANQGGSRQADMSISGRTDEPNPWQDYYLVHCRDGKTRRIKRGISCLAHGIPRDMAQIVSRMERMGVDSISARRTIKAARACRIGGLKGFGNAIVPVLAAEFVRAVMEVTNGH